MDSDSDSDSGDGTERNVSLKMMAEAAIGRRMLSEIEETSLDEVRESFLLSFFSVTQLGRLSHGIFSNQRKAHLLDVFETLWAQCFDG